MHKPLLWVCTDKDSHDCPCLTREQITGLYICNKLVISCRHSAFAKHACMFGQVLGENALLARVLLESVGSFARALGMRYRQNGRLMYTVLIPVLERLADPCPSVSAAAGAAMGSLCLHSGYSSFTELVGTLNPATSFSTCPDLPNPWVSALSRSHDHPSPPLRACCIHAHKDALNCA